MKITDLKCAIIGDNPVVRIVTDAGISGYGQAENSKPYLKSHILFYRQYLLDQDPTDAQQVDDKLVSLARQTGGLIITNDYNLNRVAKLQGVRILNINELANAVKSVYLPGEEIPLKIIQEGKEFGQGVGYLEDGTMVVVENGRRYLNQEVLVQVTKVLQTNAGRLIFATPE